MPRARVLGLVLRPEAQPRPYPWLRLPGTAMPPLLAAPRPRGGALALPGLPHAPSAPSGPLFDPHSASCPRRAAGLGERAHSSSARPQVLASLVSSLHVLVESSRPVRALALLSSQQERPDHHANWWWPARSGPRATWCLWVLAALGRRADAPRPDGRGDGRRVDAAQRRGRREGGDVRAGRRDCPRVARRCRARRQGRGPRAVPRVAAHLVPRERVLLAPRRLLLPRRGACPSSAAAPASRGAAGCATCAPGRAAAARPRRPPSTAQSSRRAHHHLARTAARALSLGAPLCQPRRGKHRQSRTTSRRRDECGSRRRCTAQYRAPPWLRSRSVSAPGASHDAVL